LFFVKGGRGEINHREKKTEQSTKNNLPHDTKGEGSEDWFSKGGVGTTLTLYTKGDKTRLYRRTKVRSPGRAVKEGGNSGNKPLQFWGTSAKTADKGRRSYRIEKDMRGKSCVEPVLHGEMIYRNRGEISQELSSHAVGGKPAAGNRMEESHITCGKLIYVDGGTFIVFRTKPKSSVGRGRKGKSRER